MKFLRRARSIITEAARGWFDDGAMSMGASIAFYTIFSLAPVVILVIATAGMILGEEAARNALTGELGRLIGENEARTVQDLVASASLDPARPWASALGILTILVGATTVFAELQSSLNRIWKVEASPRSTVAWLVKIRLKGLALIGAIGFLLIVSLAISTILAALSGWLERSFPGIALPLWIGNLLISWAVFTVLFALIYRVLPDARIPWGDLWFGAAVTTLLFLIGKYLIGLYLGTSGIASTYGAAGSFVLILLWVYYSAAIFLFGAEITRAYSGKVGSRAPRRQQLSPGEMRTASGD